MEYQSAYCKVCKFKQAVEEAGANPLRISIFDPIYVDAKIDEFVDYDNPKTFVYFISDGEFVKIGVAEKPYQRLTDIQTGNPRTLKLIALFPMKNKSSAHSCETRLHAMYDEYHLVGEWFDILPQVTRGRMSIAKLNAPELSLPIQQGENQ